MKQQKSIGKSLPAYPYQPMDFKNLQIKSLEFFAKPL
jgi:hypothetical protein